MKRGELPTLKSGINAGVNPKILKKRESYNTEAITRALKSMGSAGAPLPE